MDKAKLKELIARIEKLPTLPVVVSRINAMVQNPKTSAKEVGAAIASDPSLSAKVLRLVNSAYFGFPSQISSVTHATTILGFNAIQNLALSATVFQMFGEGGAEDLFDRRRFWEHSLGVGVISRILAEKSRYPDREEAFTAGLIHDVGKIVLDQFVHEDFMAVMNKVRAEDCLLYEAESALLGLTHANVGYILAQKWNLPKKLQDPLSYHHTVGLSKYNPQLTSIIHVADIFCRAFKIGHGGDNKIPSLDKSNVLELKLAPPDIEQLRDQTEKEIEKAEVFLEMM